ncbi:MAG: hypothetical protein AVDCRST_MAG04-518, partial [uncultured Acetobacteraceae bacterium]
WRPGRGRRGGGSIRRTPAGVRRRSGRWALPQGEGQGLPRRSVRPVPRPPLG